MKSITTFDLQYAHRFYGFKGEAQYLHGHTGTLTIEVEDSINEGVNMVFPCNEIKKTAWNLLKNFDHALILREDDPLLPAVLEVYEKQGIVTGHPQNTNKGPCIQDRTRDSLPGGPPGCHQRDHDRRRNDKDCLQSAEGQTQYIKNNPHKR